MLALQVRSRQRNQHGPRASPTYNLEAYDCYLRGVKAFWHAIYKNETFMPARQIFERAIALDAQYAAAYARWAKPFDRLVL